MSGSEPLKPCAECERLKVEHEKDRAVLIRAMVDNEKIWRRRLEAAGLNIEDRAPSPVVAEVVAGVRDEAKWLEEHLGSGDSGAYLGCVRRLRHLCTRLERGE